VEGQIIDRESTKADVKSVVTRDGCERIARFAFELARKLQRRKITIVHKANILKTTSGLFLEVAQEVASRYPDIESNEMIVDNTCMQLVMNPERFDMILTTNMFGDILSDLTAGLTGGLGMAAGANVGLDMAMFEAVHGSAPDISGKNVANPSSVLLASAMMLDYLGMKEKGDEIRHSIFEVLSQKDRLTRDLGGTSTSSEFTQAVIDHIRI
jgi:isocitrate dehydrogenase (NAD+)